MEKQSLIKGTLILGIAGILARFLGIFFRWPLIMLIGDEGVGYYQMSYPMYVFFIAASSGIPVAVSKMVSERNAFNDTEGAIQILKKALILMGIMGGGFSLFLISFSRWIIAFLKWDTKSYYSLVGMAFAPLFISIMSSFRGFFQGFQNMYPTAVSEIIEQLTRVFLGVGLAYILLPYGIEYSAGGAALGAASGGLIAGIYLISRYIKIRRGLHIKKQKKNYEILNRLIYTAVPISIGTTVSSIMTLIDSILVPQKLLQAGLNYKQAAILYGQLTGKAFVLVNVPLTLSAALCASIVPVIAEAYVLKRKADVISKVNIAIKFSMVIAFPSLCGLFFLAYPVLSLIFPGHSDGYMILKYLSISIPFVIGAQTGTAILQSIGKYMRPVINLAIGCVFKVIITYILVPIPSMNIYGAVLGTISGYVVACTLNIFNVKRVLNISIDLYNSIIKPALSSIIMIICVVFMYMYVYNNTKSNTISCLVSVFIGIIVYGVLIVLLGVLKYDSIRSKFIKVQKENKK